MFYPPRHLNFRNPFTQGPDDWQLAVKYQNGSLALELFPAAGQYGENMTTGWYTAPRWLNVVFVHTNYLNCPLQSPRSQSSNTNLKRSCPVSRSQIWMLGLRTRALYYDVWNFSFRRKFWSFSNRKSRFPGKLSVSSLSLYSRLSELKEELALGITMILNSWHLHHEILQVSPWSSTHGTFTMRSFRYHHDPQLMAPSPWDTSGFTMILNSRHLHHEILQLFLSFFWGSLYEGAFLWWEVVKGRLPDKGNTSNSNLGTNREWT